MRTLISVYHEICIDFDYRMCYINSILPWNPERIATYAAPLLHQLLRANLTAWVGKTNAEVECKISGNIIYCHMAMDQYLLLIACFKGWNWINIHKSWLFWCEQKGYKVLTHCHLTQYCPQTRLLSTVKIIDMLVLRATRFSFWHVWTQTREDHKAKSQLQCDKPIQGSFCIIHHPK